MIIDREILITAFVPLLAFVSIVLIQLLFNYRSIFALSHIIDEHFVDDDDNREKDMLVRDVNLTDPYTKRPLKLKTIEYRRVTRNWLRKYGVHWPVNTKRTTKLNYKRTILPYKRIDVHYVSDVNDDSLRCDDWMNGSLSKLQSCNVNEGSDACFKCLESREYRRQCIHLPRPLTVSVASLSSSSSATTDGTMILPANENSDQGWCLPSTFTNVYFDTDTGEAKPADEQKRSCNVNTGDWLLSRLTVNSSTYNWICRCRYPNLMTNSSDSMSDCSKPIGCMPHGQLDSRSRKGLIDPYNSGSCVCDAGYKAGFESNIGPVCVPEQIINFGLNETYQLFNMNFTNVLSHDAISQEFLRLFSPEQRPNLRLPDPCSIDSFSGKNIDSSKCSVIFATIDNQRRAMCTSYSPDYIVHTSDTDYLLNNGGLYPNSCLYTGMTTHNRMVPNTNEKVEGQFVLSYYNGTVYPDVGHVMNLDLHSKESQTHKIRNIVEADKRFQTWLMKNVKPLANPKDTSEIVTNDWTQRDRYPLRFDASLFYDEKFNKNFLIIYNSIPYDTPFTREDSARNVPFYSDIQYVFNSNEFEPYRVLLSLVSDDKTRLHPRLYEYLGSTNNCFVDMDEKTYDYPPIVANTLNCLGPGRLLTGQSLYIVYDNRSLDEYQSTAEPKFNQWFIRSENKDEIYPNYPTQDYTNDSGLKPTGDYNLAKLGRIPTISPVLRYGNRQLAPNPFHPSFDATVQVYITTNFATVMTNGYSANVLNFRNIENIKRFFSERPKELVDLKS